MDVSVALRRAILQWFGYLFGRAPVGSVPDRLKTQMRAVKGPLLVKKDMRSFLKSYLMTSFEGNGRGYLCMLVNVIKVICVRLLKLLN